MRPKMLSQKKRFLGVSTSILGVISILLFNYNIYSQASTIVSPSLLLIRAGRVVDVSEGRYLPDPGILIDGNHIKEIGSFEDVRQHIRAPYRLLDLSRLAVLPGLIDTHTHLLSNYDARIGFDDPNMILTVVQMSSPMRALMGAAMARQDLEAGITTVRDVRNSGTNTDVSLRDAIAAGYVAGPRMLVSTRALAAPGGQFPPLAQAGQALVQEE